MLLLFGFSADLNAIPGTGICQEMPLHTLRKFRKSECVWDPMHIICNIKEIIFPALSVSGIAATIHRSRMATVIIQFRPPRFRATWNCGCEGASRKKAIVELRRRQMKNALTMLFMAQGTPLIYSGDEFCNTRFGNNNPYCQDNETGWIKWNRNGSGEEIFSYIKDLIRLKSSTIAFLRLAPSQPQFHVALQSSPSALFSPLASLCFFS